jgi:hypothetical protein
MDLSKIPTDELIALKNGDLSKVSTETLMMLKGGNTAKMAREYAGEDVGNVGPLKQFAGGMKYAFDSAALGLRNLLPEGIAKGIESIAPGGDIRDIQRKGKAFVEATGPASTAGQIVGDIALSAAPSTAATKALGGVQMLSRAPMVQRALGGGIGAGVIAPEDKLETAALGTAFGGAGELALRGLGRVGGGVLSASKVTPEAQQLIDAGIPVAPWKASDSGVYRTMAERLRAMPATSRVIKNAEVRGIQGFNRALVSQFTPPDLLLDGGQVIGVKATTTPVKAIGQEGLAELKGRFNMAYDKIYRGKSVPIDDVYVRQVDDLVKQTAAYYPEEAAALNGLVQKYQDKLFAGVKESGIVDESGKKIVTGREGVNANALKEAIADLQGDISRAYKAGKNQLAELLTDYSTELEMLRVRGLPPGSADALKQVNERYSGFLQYQKAMSGVSANKANMVTPSQMITAIKASDRSKNKAAFAQGKAPNQKFALNADSVLGSELPQIGPGTAEKLLGLAALTSPLTLGADYLGALALGTRQGQALMLGQLPGQAGIRSGVRSALPYAAGIAAPMSLLYGD